MPSHPINLHIVSHYKPISLLRWFHQVALQFQHYGYCLFHPHYHDPLVPVAEHLVGCSMLMFPMAGGKLRYATKTTTSMHHLDYSSH